MLSYLGFTTFLNVWPRASYSSYLTALGLCFLIYKMIRILSNSGFLYRLNVRRYLSDGCHLVNIRFLPLLTFSKLIGKKRPNNFYLVGFTTPELTASHIHSIQMTITSQPLDVALLNCCSYFKPMFNESQETFACGFTEIKEPLSSRSKIREMCPLKLITCGH